jgi:hypothetical protein
MAVSSRGDEKPRKNPWRRVVFSKYNVLHGLRSFASSDPHQFKQRSDRHEMSLSERFHASSARNPAEEYGEAAVCTNAYRYL